MSQGLQIDFSSSTSPCGSKARQFQHLNAADYATRKHVGESGISLRYCKIHRSLTGPLRRVSGPVKEILDRSEAIYQGMKSRVARLIAHCCVLELRRIDRLEQTTEGRVAVLKRLLVLVAACVIM